MKIIKYKLFETDRSDIDPLGEEDWDDKGIWQVSDYGAENHFYFEGEDAANYLYIRLGAREPYAYKRQVEDNEIGEAPNKIMQKMIFKKGEFEEIIEKMKNLSYKEKKVFQRFIGNEDEF
jgi:hypothetical protein